MSDWRHTCPICGYPFHECQCRFTGSSHPDRETRRQVVLNNLYLLYPEQIEHLKNLQKHCQMSYCDQERSAMKEDLKRRRYENR